MSAPVSSVRSAFALLLVIRSTAILAAQNPGQSWWIGETFIAHAEAQQGNYQRARQILLTAFNRCDSTHVRAGCRMTLAATLGDLLREQANVERPMRDTLFREAVAFYDTVLSAAPNDQAILYKKALAFRSMGVHEWQEGFFREAPNRVGTLRDVFLSFQGDYFAGHQRWLEARNSYQAALLMNPEETGARAGLIEALQSLADPASMLELLRLGDEWRQEDPPSAADAYSAALARLFSQAPSGPLTEQAMVGLTAMQALNGRVLGQMPPGVPQEWAPCQELRDFLDQPSETSRPPWWMRTHERRATLALASLARGRQLVSDGRPERAEIVWRAGTTVAEQGSGVFVDLERELAMLYFEHPALDSDSQKKFLQVEREMFEEKGFAIAAEDLESVQRFHTALGLIYAARGIWRTPPIRNASDQFRWALETAAQRAGREGFYQPLPNIWESLAHGLHSTGYTDSVRQAYIEAAAGDFDVDDFEAAIRNLHAARAVSESWPSSHEDSAWVFRYSRMGAGELPNGCPANAQAQWLERGAAFGGSFRSADFRSRQTFKIGADCVSLDPMKVSLSIPTFRLVDGGEVTLIGPADVSRFNKALRVILGSVGMSTGEIHFDRVRRQGSRVAVLFPGDTRPFWLTIPQDALIGARVVAVVDQRFPITQLRVSVGFVEVRSPRSVPERILMELKRVPGVTGVVIVESRDN
jgi:tetratricopeptide (TPR) repeat protein